MTLPRRSSERRASAGAFAAFCGAAAAAIALVVVYWWNDDTALEGTFAGVCFVLLAVGLVIWSHHLVPEGPFHEEYPEPRSPAQEEAEVLAAIDRGGVGRRRLLIGSLGVTGTALAAGVVSSFRSLGPTPSSYVHTAWRGGRRLVTSEGDLVHADGVPVDGVVSVFPEGFVTAPEVAVALIRLPPGVNRPLPGRATWAPEGLVAYSKVCSHAGCPVNLYNRRSKDLMCPCHQSTFDATHGAEPVFGPAAGPLPQLPLAIDPDGALRSTGDLSGPPGPVFWHHS